MEESDQLHQQRKKKKKTHKNRMGHSSTSESSRSVINPLCKLKNGAPQTNGLPVTTPTPPPTPVVPMVVTNLEEEVITIWKRPLDKLPVYKDFCRLVSRMEIFDAKGKNLLEPPDDKKTTTDLMYDAFTVLASILEGEPLVQKIKEHFNTYFGKQPGSNTVDLITATEQFILNVIGEQSKVCSVLRAANQSIIAPAVMKLKFSPFGQAYRYKDVNGQWKVRILLLPDKVTVSHRKREQSQFDHTPADHFEFDWTLDITINSSTWADLQQILFRVVSVDFNKEFDRDKKLKILQSLEEFYFLGNTTLDGNDSPPHEQSSMPTRLSQSG